MKTITHPTTGQVYRMGRRKPEIHVPAIPLSKYVNLSVLPSPPTTLDLSGPALTALHNVYLNDTLGDCVIAGIGHQEAVFTGNANGGNPFIYSNAQITSLYGAIGGYIPGNPSTDNGCDETTALNHWETYGAPYGYHKIAGHLSVDPTEPIMYRIAMWLFESDFLGVDLPDAWVDPPSSGSGFIWDKAGAPDPENGHCVIGTGYAATGLEIATWGMIGIMTDAAMAQYLQWSVGGQLFTILSKDSINKASAKAPNGFDWEQLRADFSPSLI